MSQLTRQVIRDYIDMRQASPAKRGKHESATRKISPGTVRRELDTLSAALNFCHREGLIANVPYIEKPKPSPPREKWIKESQFGLLLAECEKRKYLMDYIMIAINTSARPGAITQLKWEQMDFENRVVDFNPEGRRQNNKIRSAVYMNDVFYEYFLERHKEAKSEWVVTRPRNGEYGPIASIKNSFKAACTRAGLTGITPYTLRHTACTWMRKSGIDLKDIGDIAGHRDPRTTMRYVKYDPEFTKGGTSKLSTGVEHAMRIAAAVKKEKDTVKNEENKG